VESIEIKNGFVELLLKPGLGINVNIDELAAAQKLYIFKEMKLKEKFNGHKSPTMYV
jgi:hypothetical protein